MKAVIRKQYGSYDKIQIVEMPLPKIRPHEALIKVHATTVNRTDQGVLTGLPYVFRFFVGLFKPTYEILGTDFVGEVVETGSNHELYKVGDIVWGFNDQAWPTQAEYTVINKGICTTKVETMTSMLDVVACAEGFHYALNFINKVEIKKGHKAFVYGATGAIGSAMIQILKYKGVYVMASCKGEYFEKVKPLGADVLFDYEKQQFSEIGEKFDFFFDAVGKSNFKASQSILKQKAIYISSELGPGAENLYLPLFTLFKSQKVIFPLPSKIANSIAFVTQMLKAGAFTPLIDKVYTIDEAPEAYAYTMSGQKIGNVILKIQ